MRLLLDTYISAEPSTVISDFENTGLIQLIVQLGAGAIDTLPPGIRASKQSVAETITNNVRKTIVDEYALNPKFYDKMSELLDAILTLRREGALEYELYLKQLLELAAKVGKRESGESYPSWADNHARRALVDFCHPRDDIAIELDSAVLYSKPDSWVGNSMREKRVLRALRDTLADEPDLSARLDELFALVKAQREYQ